jgi:hypothetical protein
MVVVPVVAGLSPLAAPLPSASAQPCPDAELVFARGTTEAPGLGPTGDAFLSSLRPRLGTRTMTVYAVDYPATTEFPTALDGIRDASNHIRATTAACPDTKLILGGFSQGAAVMGFVTANVIPDGAPTGVPNPMPAEVANHVAAVALMGKPNDRFMRAINQPGVVVGPNYAGKTIDLCVPDDAICSSGTDFNAHTQYAETGLTDQAAAFVAGHVLASLPPVTPPQAPAPTSTRPTPAAPPQALAAPAPAAPPPSPAPAAPPPSSVPVAPPPSAAAPPPDGSQPPPATHAPLPPGTLLMCSTTCKVVS